MIELNVSKFTSFCGEETGKEFNLATVLEELYRSFSLTVLLELADGGTVNFTFGCLDLNAGRFLDEIRFSLEQLTVSWPVWSDTSCDSPELHSSLLDNSEKESSQLAGREFKGSLPDLEDLELVETIWSSIFSLAGTELSWGEEKEVQRYCPSSIQTLRRLHLTVGRLILRSGTEGRRGEEGPAVSFDVEMVEEEEDGEVERPWRNLSASC